MSKTVDDMRAELISAGIDVDSILSKVKEIMDSKKNTMAAVRAIAWPFFDQGYTRVYVAECCNRILVSVVEARTCKTCGNVPKGQWLNQNDIH